MACGTHVQTLLSLRCARVFRFVVSNHHSRHPPPCVPLTRCLVQSYVEAGDFTVWTRAKTSLRENLIFYAVAAVAAAAFLIYIAIKRGFSAGDLVGFGIAASNTWGLFLLIILLGYGLVELPRSLWHASSHAMQLRHSQFRAAVLQSKRDDARENLRDLFGTVGRLKDEVCLPVCLLCLFCLKQEMGGGGEVVVVCVCVCV